MALLRPRPGEEPDEESLQEMRAEMLSFAYCTILGKGLMGSHAVRVEEALVLKPGCAWIYEVHAYLQITEY